MKELQTDNGLNHSAICRQTQSNCASVSKFPQTSQHECGLRAVLIGWYERSVEACIDLPISFCDKAQKAKKMYKNRNEYDYARSQILIPQAPNRGHNFCNFCVDPLSFDVPCSFPFDSLIIKNSSNSSNSNKRNVSRIGKNSNSTKA